MDQQQSQQTDKRTLTQSKLEWIRPEVDRLVVGGAEGSSDISTDGIDIPS